MNNNDTASGRPPMIGKRLSIDEWLAYIHEYRWGTMRPSRLVLHHTYRPTEAQWRGLRSMRGMQRFYAGKGWSAAPHIYAAPDGIWLFTPLRDVGVHAGTGNGGVRSGWYSIGLEMVGSFDDVRPSGAVWEHAKAVMGGLAQVLGIPPHELISFHRDYTDQKSCPGRAVTAEWVRAELEQWLAAHSAAAPAPPADPAGLAEALRQLTYEQRGGGFHADWAFHRTAVAQNLGAPVGASQHLVVGAARLNYQAFGRDVLFCEVPKWAEVRSLAATLTAAPADPAAQALRAAIFRAARTRFDPRDTLLAAAGDLRAGPPLAAPRPVYIGARRGRLLVCAADTLFLPEGATAVERLSASQGADAMALVLATFEALGLKQAADHPFTQAALQPWLGAPLSGIQPLELAGRGYVAQVSALDTLVAADEQGRALQRLSTLGTPAPQQKGAAEAVPVRSIHVAALECDAAALVDMGTPHDLTGAHLLVTSQGMVLPVPRAQMPAPEDDPDTLLVLVAQEVGGAAISSVQTNALTRLLHTLEQRYHIPRAAVRWG